MPLRSFAHGRRGGKVQSLRLLQLRRRLAARGEVAVADSQCRVFDDDGHRDADGDAARHVRGGRWQKRECCAQELFEMRHAPQPHGEMPQMEYENAPT